MKGEELFADSNFFFFKGKRLLADAKMRQYNRQLHMYAIFTLRHRLHAQRRDGDLRGRRRVRVGHARLRFRLSVQKHPGLLSLRSHPAYTDSAATHVTDSGEDDNVDDDHDYVEIVDA